MLKELQNDAKYLSNLLSNEEPSEKLIQRAFDHIYQMQAKYEKVMCCPECNFNKGVEIDEDGTRIIIKEDSLLYSEINKILRGRGDQILKIFDMGNIR